jgi:hypothetical protein
VFSGISYSFKCPGPVSADWTGASLGDSIANHVNEVLSRPLICVWALMRDCPRLIPGWSRPPFRLGVRNSIPIRSYPARPFRDSQIIKIVGLPVSLFGLRLLGPPIETSSLGLRDAISLGEDAPPLGSVRVLFGCFVIVTHLTEVLQIPEAVSLWVTRLLILETEDMIDMSSANKNMRITATAAPITSIPDNSFFDVSWNILVMVWFRPLGRVFLPYAARHERAPIS